MAATVQLRLGDMFEGPTDLIVVPCSVIPTITRFVAERLEHFSIPEPTRPMQLGEVEFLEFTGAENIAPWVAFAASVKGEQGSELEAIREIARRLGRFTREKAEVQAVTTPLLGTGAGGLEPAETVERLRDGFLQTCSDDAQLRIHVIDESVYQRLQGQLGDPAEGAAETAAEREPVRVFVSYTRASEEHVDWVRSVATALRQNGVEARLDRWHCRPGMDLVQWMCNELDQADRVLLICNEEYARRSDRRHGGVGWETRIVQGDLFATMYGEETDTDKYVPIVTTENARDGLPGFLQATYYVHWPGAADDAQKLDELLRIVYRAYEEAPPRGRPPAHLVGHRSRS